MTRVRDEDEQPSNSKDWLSRLNEACQSIASKSDLDEVVQVVVDGAREITGGRSGTVEFVDSPDLPNEYRTNKSEGERGENVAGPQGQHSDLGTIEAPLVLANKTIGAIRVGGKEGTGEFTSEDEQALRIFAAHATLAISGAAGYLTGHRAKAELAALLDASPAGVLVFDLNSGALLAVNEETRRIMDSLEASELPVEQLLEGAKLRRSDGQLSALTEISLMLAVMDGETIRSEEVVIRLPNGRSVTTVVNASPIRADNGEVVSVVVTIKDIQDAQKTQGLRSDLLGLMNHELRTPLTTIKGSAATALGSSTPLDANEMRQFFRIIDQQANHLRALMRNLHDLARIEDGTFRVDIQPCRIGEILDQAVSLFSGDASRPEVVIPGPNTPHRIGADSQRVLQVLSSLLAYIPRVSSGSEPIKLAASPEGDFIAVSIEQRTGGFPAIDMSTLLERGPNSGMERVPDILDLELAVCKGIVAAHGGSIRTESGGQGQFTRFTFTLPALENANEYGEIEEDSGHVASATEYASLTTVLIVDDDAQTLVYAKEALTSSGYAAIATSSPYEANRLLEAENPDVILLDLMLPGVDGLELIERIPKIAYVPVIFLSDRGREHDVERAFEKGGDDYIVKPFLAAELVARVKAALRKREMFGQPRLPEVFRLGEVAINYAERKVSVAGRSVQLTATEYKLLFEFSISGGRVMTHDQLLKRVWGMTYGGDTRLLRAFVKSLRRKLGDDAGSPSYIFTEPGVGYRLAKAQA